MCDSDQDSTKLHRIYLLGHLVVQPLPVSDLSCLPLQNESF